MRGSRLTGLAVGLVALLVFRTTLLPGVYAWDTGEAQTVLPLMGTMHPTGFPAYVLLGWLAGVVLAPFGDPAFRTNLLSAILVATAVGVTVPLLRRLAVPVPVAAAAALGFALTPIVWSISAAADAHALHLALVALIVTALVRWGRLVTIRDTSPGDPAAAGRADRGIVLAAALFGVGLANHGLTILLIPAVGLFVLATDRGILRRPRLIAAALGACFGVAALLYLQLPLRAGPFPAPLVYGHPDTWNGFWEIVLARQFQGDFRGLLGDLAPKAADLARFAFAQLGVLAVLVPPAFLVTAIRHPRYALLSGTAVAVTCLFAASYLNANIGRYYLGPALFAWSWLAIAAGSLVDLVFARATTGPDDEAAFDTPPGPARLTLRQSVAVVLAVAMLVPTGVALIPRWRAVDRSADTTMRLWLDELMATLEPGAVVVSWWSLSTPIWYGQLVEGSRPDVLLIDDSNLVNDNLGTAEDVIDDYLGERPVYVIRATAPDLQALAVRYVIDPTARPAGVYRVTGHQETEP
ncbi:MAG TPA: DUF2723 domain-containing protein [Candidatus Limnocylindrales bacterium]|nr:DUF2723 domain-containing protein [Candidatus Limnocylindrales bacterium]